MLPSGSEAWDGTKGGAEAVGLGLGAGVGISLEGGCGSGVAVGGFSEVGSFSP